MLNPLDRGDRKRIAETKRMDDIFDRLNSAITAYLTRIDPEELDQQDNRRLSAILAFTTNLEHAGDVIAKNLMGLAAKRWKRGLAFSGEDNAEIRAILERLRDNLRAARRLVEEKDLFRDLETRATEAHFERVRTGQLESIESATLQLDVMRDLRRINGHLVSAAYPVLRERGEPLSTSRLRHGLV